MFPAAGGFLRGDDDAAGRICDADGLPAEQLQGAAAAVHGTGVLLLHRHRGGPHARYAPAAGGPGGMEDAGGESEGFKL